MHKLQPLHQLKVISEQYDAARQTCSMLLLIAPLTAFLNELRKHSVVLCLCVDI